MVYRSDFGSSAFRAFEYRAVFLLTFDAKVHAIPVTQLFRIVCLKENSADSSNAFQVVMLLISNGPAVSAAASAWALELDPLRGWIHLESSSLSVGGAFRRHAIERSVNENHVVDRFSAILIICFPSEAVKAVVPATIDIDHEDSAQVIVAAVSSRAIELVAHQEE